MVSKTMQLVNWVCGYQDGVEQNLFVDDPRLISWCFDAHGAPIHRNESELMALRKRSLPREWMFPLDQLALIALNRSVQQPIQFAQVREQMGRVVTVAYAYPHNPDPILPVPLLPLTVEFDEAFLKLARHVEGYNIFHNQRRWGRKARNLCNQLIQSLWGVSNLKRKEKIFIVYQAELAIVQPGRR